MLDEAARLGLNFLRVWAFTVTCEMIPGCLCKLRGVTDDHSPNRTAYPLQLAPSVYDDNIFRGLDFILDAAGKRGIKIALVLADWW